MRLSKYLSFFALAIIISGFAGRSEAASSYTFPAFDAGTLTGGGPAFTNTLSVTNVPAGEYLAFRVSANYQSVPQPNDAFPNTMQMGLSDGGTNVFWVTNYASVGAVDGDYTNLIAWSGVFQQKSYQGGSNLVIQFMDTYNDANGPYYSTMSNVVVTIYPAPARSQTLTSFNVGTLIGGGAAYTNSLNITNLSNTEYLVTRVTANYQSAPPNGAKPISMEMLMSDGGTNIYWPATNATLGAVNTKYTNVIGWAGVFPQASYFGGSNLTVQFMDIYDDGNGPYYSTMSNVVVALFPVTTPSYTFPSFDAGTIIGGGATNSKALNVSSIPHGEYLYARITAHYQSGPPASNSDAYPSTMEMQLSDGGTNVFWPFSLATAGAVYADYTNIIAWSGVLPARSYQGGTNLTVQFLDPAANNTGSGGPYYSTMSNVVVTLYPAVSAPPTPPQLNIMDFGANVVLAWTNTATGFTLESATNLISPITWTAVSPAPVNVNGQFTVTNAVSNSQLFYRLNQ